MGGPPKSPPPFPLPGIGLVGPSFQGTNKAFVSSFEGNAVRTRHRGYFISSLEKNYVMIDERNSF